MSFIEIVKKVREGDRGVSMMVVIAYDGLIIEEWKDAGIDMDLSALAAEMAQLLKECKRISVDLGLSMAEELTFKGKDYMLHSLSVGDEYFILVMTSETYLSGKSRFYIKSVIPSLKAFL